jgi:formylglycine-generating enzyme required for sulfatase activity
MGSPQHEEDREADEHLHEVEITRPFHVGIFPVTQQQYQKVMGTNPSHFSANGGGQDEVQGLDTGNFPVESVSWEDAVAFCQRLSELPEEKRCGRVYRLPSEAEWEYACRAGTSAPFHFGRSLSSTQANFDGNFPYGGAAQGPYLWRTTAVGSYKPNAWGLYDMHGNVWECCSDWYAKDYYKGARRVIRGGCWSSRGHGCRSAYRGIELANRDIDLGFRVALVLSGR